VESRQCARLSADVRRPRGLIPRTRGCHRADIGWRTPSLRAQGRQVALRRTVTYPVTGQAEETAPHVRDRGFLSGPRPTNEKPDAGRLHALPAIGRGHSMLVGRTARLELSRPHWNEPFALWVVLAVLGWEWGSGRSHFWDEIYIPRPQYPPQRPYCSAKVG